MTTFPLPGAQNADFGTVYADKDGSLWVASANLYRINPRRSASELIPPLSPGIRVRDVLRDHTGILWVGTEGHGVFVSKGGTQVHYTTRNGLTNDFIRAFLESRDGSIWIGTDEGLNRWHDGVLTRYRMSEGLSYFSIRALLEDTQGDIWIGTEQGVSHWQNGKFVEDAVTERLRSEKVWTMHQDRDGGLWFGTRGGGLFRWRAGKLSAFTSAQGLASNSIYQILEDQRGTFWMSGPNGIVSVARADLDKQAEAPEFRPAVTLYGLSDGVEATQMHGGVAPAGCLTPSGELWFPSNRGPVRILPDQTRPGVLPRVVIEQVLVDGREVRNSGYLVVPPGEGKLEINYSAIRQEDPRAKCLVLTTYEGDEDIHQALAAGALGYIIKGMSHETLVDALRRVHSGSLFLPPPVMRSLADRTPNLDLSPREREVLSLIVRGESNKEIANELGITEATVKCHVSVILQRLGVNDRTQAVIAALQRGLEHL
jgi:DNA-binding NarL/FixJ family response regulator/streptogramin lyase